VTFLDHLICIGKVPRLDYSNYEHKETYHK
jgi:hypothetical protein